MSDVASKELCQQLSEVSGWEDYDLPHYAENCDTAEDYEYIMSNDFGEAFPAYDLGYLLRKLPATITGVGLTRIAYLQLEKRDSAKYFATYDKSNGHSIFNATADTPEDACAKLCITLFKAGLLTREEQDDKQGARTT